MGQTFQRYQYKTSCSLRNMIESRFQNFRRQLKGGYRV